MQVQTFTQFDPKQFFNLPASTIGAGQRLDTQVSGVNASNDLAHRLSVTRAERDKVTLLVDLEYDFRAVNYQTISDAGGIMSGSEATYAEHSLKREFGVTVEGDLNEQELHDLEKLFRNISSIFQKFLHGQDESGMVGTASLAERFGKLSSLTSLDLGVDIQRSLTVLVTQITSEMTGQQTLASAQDSQVSTTDSLAAPLGGVPAADAAIPQPSTGTTAPTPLAPASSAANPGDGFRLNSLVHERDQNASLIQQVLDTLKEAPVEQSKVRKYLPSFLQRFVTILEKSWRAGMNTRATVTSPPINQTRPPSTNSTVNTALLAYQAVSQTSISLSIHS